MKILFQVNTINSLYMRKLSDFELLDKEFWKFHWHLFPAAWYKTRENPASVLHSCH